MTGFWSHVASSPAARAVTEARHLPALWARVQNAFASPERAAALFGAILLPVMLVLSPDYGATWDEDLQQRRGEKIAAFYMGRVADLAFPDDGAHLYGAPFDVLAVGLQQLVPADPYVVRHALNAFIGWAGIVFCGLLANRLFGAGTALLAMMLLAGVPRYFGHSMNNIKDIPFATLATAILYGLASLSARYPFFTVRRALGLAVAIGLALNVRPGALLFLGYLAVLLLYRLTDGDRLRMSPLIRTAGWMLGITLVTVLLGSLFWPWALERPLVGPFLGLAQLSRFGWDHYILFAGRDVYGLQPPWDYVPRWLLLTSPLVLLVGLVLSLPLLRSNSGVQSQAIALWAVVLFPIVYVIGVRAVMYDGIRHLLFIQPPLAILAAAGWVWAWRRGPTVRRIAVGGALAIGLAQPIAFAVREHPNQVVYFNELTGGPAGAYGRYEMDYWGNCLLQALSHAERLAPVDMRVTVSGWPLHIIEANASRFPGIRVVDRESREYQLDLILGRGSRKQVLDLAAREDMVASVTTSDGALLCAVLPGPAYNALAEATSSQAATTGSADDHGR